MDIIESKKFKPEIFEVLSEEFSNHLKITGNERIVFSGIYGIGKTTFLRHFFSNQGKAKELTGIKYNTFHLYPVNYSVSSNEDIFKYLKFDIIYELIETFDNDDFFETVDISYIQQLPHFIQNNLPRFIAPLMLLIPVVGRTGFKIYEEAEKLKNKFLKDYEANSVKDDKIISDYISEFIEREGSIYENNIYTKFIENSLEILKAKDSNTENVLILDDLDRIDPNHIFRLLNVFAAHFDEHRNENNKFGFDKIIVVCDIKNVQNIFSNRYGSDVDFNGYIDKFYSKGIFSFDNRNTIKSLVYEFVNKIKLEGHNEPHTANLLNSVCIRRQLNFLLAELVLANKLNLRGLFKYFDQPIDLTKIDTIELQGKKIHNWQVHIYHVFEILISILGNVNYLIEGFEECLKRTNYDDNNETYRGLLSDLLIILAHKEHSFEGEEVRYKYQGNNYKFKIVKSIGSNDIRTDTITINNIRDGQLSTDIPNIFEHYINVVNLLNNAGYLK